MFCLQRSATRQSETTCFHIVKMLAIIFKLLLLQISAAQENTLTSASIRNLLNPTCHTVEVFTSIQNDAFLEQTLTEILKNASVGVRVFTDTQQYCEISEQLDACAVLLLDHLPQNRKFMQYNSKIHTIATTNSELFSSLFEVLTDLNVYNVIYFEYNSEQMLKWRFYNLLQRRLMYFESVDHSLFWESGKDMMGLEFSIGFPEKRDLFLFENIATVRNATLLNHTRRAVQTHVCILNELVYVFEDDPDSVPYLLYMHRFHYYRLIVPQSSKKQLLSVLSDPFDKYVWMISVVSVFILALFVKFARDRKLVWMQVFDTFVKLLGVGLMGTLIRPHSSIERFTLGLFMLMSIVLVSAYQSLVISFLLSTRFHPELDSLRQVNESCTWSHDAGNLELREAGFLHYGECDAVDMDEMSLNDQVKSMFEQKCCVEIPENVCEMYFKENIVNEYFRVSKVITRQLPVLHY